MCLATHRDSKNQSGDISINSKMGPRHMHPHARHMQHGRGRVSSPSQQTHRVTSHRIKQLHGHRRKFPQRRCCCNSTSGQPAVPGDAVDIGWPAHLLVIEGPFDPQHAPLGAQRALSVGSVIPVGSVSSCEHPCCLSACDCLIEPVTVAHAARWWWSTFASTAISKPPARAT